jgi:hypothetical protein
MDLDSNEEKYYASEDIEDEGKPYSQFLENSDNGPSTQREMTAAQMF